MIISKIIEHRMSADATLGHATHAHTLAMMMGAVLYDTGIFRHAYTLYH